MAFTQDYFRLQALELRERFGTRKFWQDPDAVKKAGFALSWVYLNLEDIQESDTVLFDSTMDELSRREIFWLMMPEGLKYPG